MLGEQLKLYRKEKGFTQDQVAEKIFVSQKSISNWENNRTLPDLDSLIRLAQLYDFSLDKLLIEGSDLVENIKKIEQLKKLRLYLIAPLVTDILFIFLIIFQWVQTAPANPYVVVALFAGLFTNLFPIIYYVAEIYQLNPQKSPQPPKKSQRKVELYRTVYLSYFAILILCDFFFKGVISKNYKLPAFFGFLLVSLLSWLFLTFKKPKI